MPQIDYDEMDVDWLDTLIHSYMRLMPLDPDAREDEDAAVEMVQSCRWLAQRLRAALPAREPAPVLTAAEMDDIPW